MMARLPRSVSGEALVRGLERVGYTSSRQQGSHVSMTTSVNGEHRVTVPLHNALKLGTFAAIIRSVSNHLHLDRDDLLRRMNL